MKKFIFSIVTSLLIVNLADAQELQCNFQVNSDQIQGSNKEIFQTLQRSLTEFINNTRWTNLVFAESEKIECNMTLIIASVSEDNMFTGELLVQSRRPVFNTSYSTTLLNHRDANISFSYQEFDRLEFNNNTFTNNLTALIGYYCYLIIGMDMDSYSRLGGSPFFQLCEDIVSSAQTQQLSDAEMAGWTSHTLKGSNRNRHMLASNLNDEAFKPLRNFFYEYHRLALDQMTTNVANARAKIAEGLPVLKEANRARPSSFIVSTFLDAKADELVNIFKRGSSEEKEKVYNLLMDVDPTRQNTYKGINE